MLALAGAALRRDGAERRTAGSENVPVRGQKRANSCARAVLAASGPAFAASGPSILEPSRAA